MKYGARPLILLVVVSACSPDTQTAAERAAAAARADSSAAGYEVGPATSVTTGALPLPPDSAPKPSATGPGHGVGGQGVTGSPQPLPVDTVKTPVIAAGGGNVATSGGGRSGTSGGRGSVSTTGRGARQDSGTTIPPLDPALEPNYIAYDTALKTVTFQLAAGDEIREQVSFNASQRGGRILTVPLGWRVTIAFVNRDPDLPHSATVVDVSGPIPEELPEPVFLRAQTVRMTEGLLEGDADEVLFTADRVGRYMIACGVLGHAQRGQWLTLEVSTTAPRPTYR